MATLAEMQTQRAQILREIERRGGVAKAPGFAAQLNAIDAQIRTARAATTAATAPTPEATAKQTVRQETRLEYLKRVDPKNPEIQELEKKIANATNPSPGAGTPAAGTPGASDPAVSNSDPAVSNPAVGDRGTGTVGSDTASPYNMKSVDDFLEGALEGLGDLDLSGAPKILTAADLAAQRQQTQDSLYAEDTKYLDRNRARDLEEKKQELANRGIAYNPEAEFDPNSKDLYGRTIGAINENYSAEQQSALNRARIGADQRMATEAGVNKAASDAFVTNAVHGWQSKLDKLNTGNSLLDTLIRDYHMTRAEAEQALQRKSNERIAKAGIRAKSSGGGQQSSGDSGGGFEIIS